MPLTLTNVNHAYEKSTMVLRDVNLSINEGASIAITGPSGSGKSTLLAIAGLLLAPTSGAVLIDGSLIPSRASLRERARTAKVSWVFQTMNVIGERSALDNVALPLVAKGVDRTGARLRSMEVLASLELEYVAHRQANLLSGGELQRVCIARALNSHTTFLLADEPTGNLDRESTETVINTLRYATRFGVGLLVATHDEEVAHSCSRTARLVDGTLDWRTVGRRA